MSERDREIEKVKAKDRENSRLISNARRDLGVCQASIFNYQKRMKQLELEHKLHIDNFQERLDRAIKNAKYHQEQIDHLINEKEKLHKELKKAIHLNEVQCEYCKNWYKSPESLERHQKSCASRPGLKAVEEHREEIDILKERVGFLKEAKTAINNKIEELDPNKIQCPECKEWFTKGGAFVNHYKSHFPNGNGDEKDETETNE